SALWGQYQNDTISICVLSHFFKKVEDEEVRPIIEFVLNFSKNHVNRLKEFFYKEKFPVPVGFTADDV
ncbi:DUF3231 family protein, partial [Priestia megaterium]